MQGKPLHFLYHTKCLRPFLDVDGVNLMTLLDMQNFQLILLLLNKHDKTFEFERRRNMPKRYDRNVQNTLKAIKQIEEVRISKEAKLWENMFVSFSSTLFLFVLLIAPVCPNIVDPPYNICLFSNLTFVVVIFFLFLLVCLCCTFGVTLVLIIICISLVVAISKAGWPEINLQT